MKPESSVFIFDASYPCVDIALPLDEAKRHVIVSDRDVEPPPGHQNLQLEETRGLVSFLRNVRLLRSAWRRLRGERGIVVASVGVRRTQLLLNIIYARMLSRDIVLFEERGARPLRQSWRPLLVASIYVLARFFFRKLKLAGETLRAMRRGRLIARNLTKEDAVALSACARFGVYDVSQSFSLPVDNIIFQPPERSIYGSESRGWYLPTLSHLSRCYAVKTTRHRLGDVFLHIENVGGSPTRFLFKDRRILDYPYLIGKRRRGEHYVISTCRETKSIERGIDLLPFSTTYYHWLVEAIPRILDLIDDGVDFSEYPLITPTLEPFQLEALNLLGVSVASQVITVAEGDWCRVRDCIVPSANFAFAAADVDDPSGEPDFSHLLRIRERLLDRIPDRDRKYKLGSTRLYISREKAGRRKFSPEAESAVRSVLQAEGFQTICLEEYRWVEQIAILSGATFVAGLHGAGLANILFSQARALLEFQIPLAARSHFAVMARELKMDYQYLMCPVPGYSLHLDNITLPLEELIEQVRRELASRF